MPADGDDAIGVALEVALAIESVLRKLLWFRQGGGVSEKQWRDVVEVLRVSGGEMDRTYLESWATRLDLESLLAKAESDAGT